jgi:uncharacterized protein (TIGR00290 family)
LPSHATLREPIVLSWSGGKDSSLALAALRADERFDVVGLLTSVTRGYDRISIHGVRRTLLAAQAESLGIPVHEVTLEPACTNDDYERAFRDAVARLRTKHPELRRIAFGDLFLEDVRRYRERLLASAGVEGFFPLWGRDTTALADEFVASGYRAHLVCVDTTQLSATFAGAEFDGPMLAALPASVDRCGEHGEFHTFVWDGPIFARPIPVERGEVVMREERFAYCELLPIGRSGDRAV